MVEILSQVRQHPSVLPWKEMRIGEGSKETQRLPWDSLFCPEQSPYTPEQGVLWGRGSRSGWQWSCPLPALPWQHRGCSNPHLQAHLVRWHMVVLALSPCVSQAGPRMLLPASLCSQTLGAPRVGQCLRVGHVIASPCCRGVREVN